MANPQIEKGHTRIANEILEHISKTNLNGTQFRIVMVLWRYTYGFHRKEHPLSNAYISQAIGIKNRAVVIRELNVLIGRKIIMVVGNGSRGAKILKFNKNYEEWSSRQIEKEENPELPKKTVDDNKKNPSKPVKTYDPESSYFKMAVYFHDKVSAVAKEAGVEHLIRKANLQSWADDFRKLVEKDGVDKRLIKNIMDWVTQDDFWKTNVLSAKKLREKFSALANKMNAAKKPKQPVKKQKDIKDKEIEFQHFIENGGEPSEFDWGK
jgi:phage replication O-like protein O